MQRETKINKISKTGFTLVELLIVISIIVLLTSVILLAFGNTRIKARNAKRVADMQQVVKGMELYYTSCNSYPQLPPATTNLVLSTTQALYSGTASGCGGSNGVLPNGGIGAGHAPGAGETMFVQIFPTAPQPIDDGSLAVGSKCTEANTATANQKWGEYSYISFAPTQYWIYFCISMQVGSLAPGRWIITERGVTQFAGNYYP
jgi:prepilin-type N-terminal cleavage/methylation domain-containing protein